LEPRGIQRQKYGSVAAAAGENYWTTNRADIGQRHFIALDSLRGIAALSVVLFHVGWMNVAQNLSYVRNSYLMVDVFFVLSGFVIFHAYNGRLQTAQDVLRFIWLRFWRIYPLHFALVMVFLAIEAAKYFVQLKFGLVASNPAFTVNNWNALIGNVLLVQSLHIYKSLTFNGPAWSISVEFYTYLLFALMAWCIIGRARILFFAAAISVLGMVLLVHLGPVGTTFDFGILRCLAGFFLGGLTFALYESLHATRMAGIHSRLTGWLALSAMMGFALFLTAKQPGSWDLAVYPLAALLILFVALATPSGPVGFLGARPLRWLGTVSYSIYMVHTAILWFVAQLIRFGEHAREVRLSLHEEPILMPSAAVGILALALAIGLVLVVSHVSYTWIEKPFRDWSKGAWRSQSPASSKEGLAWVQPGE
jgi:peptidoglycan/LPS O-acetylase OafA/YrhL